MPEGDTIFRTATVLRRALAGRVVTGFELVAPKVTPAAARRQVVGGTVKAVESNGKHLLITFTTDGEDVVLHTHMRMQGQWHVYRPGQRWWFAPSKARVVIRTDEYVAPCETPPVVELMTVREIALHPVLPELGPDVIADDFDLEEGLRRLRAQPERDIATAFLDQRTLSGIGNEIKNETLFITRTCPGRRSASSMTASCAGSSSPHASCCGAIARVGRGARALCSIAGSCVRCRSVAGFRVTSAGRRSTSDSTRTSSARATTARAASLPRNPPNARCSRSSAEAGPPRALEVAFFSASRLGRDIVRVASGRPEGDWVGEQRR